MIRLTAWAVCVVWAFSVGAQDAPPDVREVFRLFSEERDELRSMQAQFTQLTMTGDEDIESTGTIVYVNPKRIIFRYDGPPVIVYMIDRTNAYEYDEELEQILVYDIAGQPEAEAFFIGLESDPKQVQEAYDMRLLPAENSERDAFALELVPKPIEDEEPLFKKVTLQLGKENYLPNKIEIINSEDHRVTFEISGFVLNAEMERSVSHIFISENTDVMINDVVLDPVGPQGRYFPDDPAVNESEDASDDE